MSIDGGATVDMEKATDDDNERGVVGATKVVGEVNTLGVRDGQSCSVGLGEG